MSRSEEYLSPLSRHTGEEIGLRDFPACRWNFTQSGTAILEGSADNDAWVQKLRLCFRKAPASPARVLVLNLTPGNIDHVITGFGGTYAAVLSIVTVRQSIFPSDCHLHMMWCLGRCCNVFAAVFKMKRPCLMKLLLRTPLLAAWSGSGHLGSFYSVHCHAGQYVSTYLCCAYFSSSSFASR